MVDETIVEQEGITVTKSFDSEGFPVPAVTFRVESDRTDPVAVRIVDEIPAGFGIEQIGFHPDYGSEHWTATGDGVVRFERTVEAGEAFTTVYGVRMDKDEEPTPFLDAPAVDVDPDALADADLEEVVPKESSEIVRELARGDRDTVPGLEDEPEGIDAEPAADVGDEPAEPEPATAESTEDEASTEETDVGKPTEPMPGDGAEILDEDEADEEPEEAESTEPAPASADPDQSPIEAAGAAAEEDVDRAADADDLESPLDSTADRNYGRMGEETMDDESTDTEASVESTPDEPVEEERTADPVDSERAEVAPTADETDAESLDDVPVDDLVAALADEIRSGDVADDDLAVIREAVVQPSASEQVRMEHLQSRVSDLEAYTDALEDFLDENGRARTLLSDLKTDIEDVEDDVDRVRSRVESAQGEREALRERVNTLADDLEAIEDATDRLDRLEGDLEALDERVADAEEATMAVSDLREEVEALQEDVEEFRQWRDQLSSVFG
ncbi:MAG: hypothetical protein ABEJ67_01090 [Halanaeroarchaeum sp.]